MLPPHWAHTADCVLSRTVRQHTAGDELKGRKFTFFQMFRLYKCIGNHQVVIKKRKEKQQTNSYI